MESRNPETLVSYAAGELDLETAQALEQHLASCSHCRAVAAEQAALWKALDKWQAPSVSLDFDRRLYRRMEEEARRSFWQRMAHPFRPMLLRQFVPLTVSAGLLLMVGLILEHPHKVATASHRAEAVRAEQVERTLDDLELLQQFSAAQTASADHADAM